MKPSTILMVLTGTATATMRLPLLEERALDPATMDPAHFSILKVLKSAMPSSTDVPMPKADFEPEWYQKLPADVKALLPGLYPVIGAAAATSEVLGAGQSTSTSAAATATTTEGVSTTVSASVSVSSAASSLSSPSASVESTLRFFDYFVICGVYIFIFLISYLCDFTVVKLDSIIVTIFFFIVFSFFVIGFFYFIISAIKQQHSDSLVTVHALVYRICLYPPTAPANKTTLATGPSPKPTVTLSLPSAATSTRPANAGVRMTVKTDMLAAVAWVCVGAGFVIFA
ncbi:hypothetical protein CFE70_000996 [Pyrenophora teres f. teres 0-1]